MEGSTFDLIQIGAVIYQNYLDFKKKISDLYCLHKQKTSDIVADYRSTLMVLVGLLGFFYTPTLACRIVLGFVVLAASSGFAAIILEVICWFAVRNAHEEFLNVVSENERGASVVPCFEDNLVSRSISVVNTSLIEIVCLGLFSLVFAALVCLFLLTTQCR